MKWQSSISTLCLWATVSLTAGQGLSPQPFYRASDFTDENIFSENIEGPCVDQKGDLYVVNFQKNGTIGHVHPDGTVTLFVTLPDGSTGNAIMFDTQGNMLIADWTGHNILKVDMRTKVISVFCHDDRFNQPNDITIDRSNRLFASDPDWKNGTGKLWRIEAGGAAVLLKDGMGTTNGIELSPDEKILYVNESKQRTIRAFDLSAGGALSRERLFHEFDDFGLDGMKCDEEGNLLVARHDKGVIAMLTPAGKLLREVALKGKKVSNIAFGGNDGRTCYVTLQDRKGMETFRSEFRGKRWKK